MFAKGSIVEVGVLGFVECEAKVEQDRSSARGAELEAEL